MTLDRLTEIINQIVAQDLERGVPCKIIFEININQGGIGDCKLKTEGNLNSILD